MQHYNSLPNSEIKRRISEYIHSERDRSIMKYRLVDGYTHERIAEILSLSTDTVKRAIKRLKPMIEKPPNMHSKSPLDALVQRAIFLYHIIRGMKDVYSFQRQSMWKEYRGLRHQSNQYCYRKKQT